MSYAFIALCASSMTAYFYETTDYRVGLFFMAVLSGMAAIATAVIGL